MVDGDRKKPLHRWHQQQRLTEMLDAIAAGRVSAGRYAPERILKAFDEEVAPTAIDLLIWDMETSGELDPFT